MITPALVTSHMDYSNVGYMELPLKTTWESAVSPECDGMGSYGQTSVCPCYIAALSAALAACGLPGVILGAD